MQPTLFLQASLQTTRSADANHSFWHAGCALVRTAQRRQKVPALQSCRLRCRNQPLQVFVAVETDGFACRQTGFQGVVCERLDSRWAALE